MDSHPHRTAQNKKAKEEKEKNHKNTNHQLARLEIRGQQDRLHNSIGNIEEDTLIFGDNWQVKSVYSRTRIALGRSFLNIKKRK